MNVPPELLAKILAMPGTTVNGVAVGANVPAPAPPEFRDEGHFQDWLNAFARGRGWKVFHNRDSRGSEPGFPDTVLLRVVPGAERPTARLVVAELKLEGQKPTDAQRDWLKLFEAAGAETFTWWPHDIEAIRAVLA